MVPVNSGFQIIDIDIELVMILGTIYKESGTAVLKEWKKGWQYKKMSGPNGRAWTLITWVRIQLKALTFVLLILRYVVQCGQRALRRTDHSSIRVLPSV
jgi:hypothetical protein